MKTSRLFESHSAVALGILLVAMLINGLQAFAAEVQMRVKTDNLNMRAQPSREVETVEPQLNAGDVVTVKNIVGQWAEIVPPRDAKLYIHREFTRDGIVDVSRLRVRAGPSVNYKDVGMLERGDSVNVRGSLGDWLQIEPPENSSLWVSLEYLEEIRPDPPARQSAIRVPQPIVGEQVSTPDRPPEQRKPVQREERVPERVERRPDRPVRTEPEIPVRQIERRVITRQPDREEESQLSDDFVPEGLDLIPLEGQGSSIEMTGILRRSGLSPFSNRPTRYRLVVIRGNGFATICYIQGNENQLRSLRDQRLQIRGRQYWVRGQDVPVIVPTQIIPLN